jgi:coenzyme F420 biosynthesis associated uncharacterized protein
MNEAAGASATAEPAVDWAMAQRVAERIARRDAYREFAADLDGPFTEYTRHAEQLVAATTGLPRLGGDARARVVDRAGWIEANVASFQRLLRPLTDRFADRLGKARFPEVSRRLAGVEAGAMLGWMSSRVLGQYDLLLVEDDRAEEQDLVYYVGPNIVALERRFAFPAEQFRLWIAVHECTHRAQFTGVPWLRPYFLSLVSELLESVDPDPRRLAEGLRAAVKEARSGRSPLDRGGLAAVMATPRQRDVLDRVAGLMSLLEGHGDVIMTRATDGIVPSAERFERVLRARRESASGLARLLQKLVGIEAKLAQYAEGERFIAAVEREGGMELFDRVWRSAEWLPTLEEVREPEQWIGRVRLSEGIGT